MKLRVGQSTDIHQLIEGENLVIGGVSIKHNKGTVAHSDGDVLVHAIMESIIGALGLGDIGKYFSDEDLINKNRSSLNMLSEVKDMLEEHQYNICNIDSIIIVEKPKLADFIDEMKFNIASVLNIDISDINIKATRGEKIGFIGREEGVMAQAVTLIKNDEK